MTATGNPTAALTACIDVLANIPEPHYSPAILPALIEARKALCGQPFPAASLETAACIWEAVLDMEKDGEERSADGGTETRGAMIRAAREAMGSGGLRLTAIGWTAQIDAAWLAADTDNGRVPDGGEYGEAFDWEFVPDWIAANIDWSNPHCPTVRKPAPRSPYDALSADLRAWLVDEMGMQAELGGGGCTYLRHEGPNGSHILVTCYGGGGMPLHDSWQVGTYRTGDGDSVLDFASDDTRYTLRAAVSEACDFLASSEADPLLEPIDAAARLSAVVERLVRADVIPDAEAFAAAMRDAGDLLARLGIKVEPDADPESDPLNIIADGVALLDTVNDTSTDNGRLFLHLADGRTVRVTAELI